MRQKGIKNNYRYAGANNTLMVVLRVRAEGLKKEVYMIPSAANKRVFR